MRFGRKGWAIVLAGGLAISGCGGSEPSDGAVEPSSSSTAAPSTSEPITTTAPPTTVTSSTTSTTTTTTTTITPTTITAPPIVWPELASSDPGLLVTPSGIALPIISTDGRTFQVRTPCGNTGSATEGEVVVSAHVVIDPGHGGSETGAVGPTGLRESDVNLAVARVAADLLRDAGAAVVLTRTDDTRLTLRTRADIAKAVNAPAMVSIHHNAEPDGASPVPGSETWYQSADNDSRRLAGLLYQAMVAALTPFDADWQSDSDAGAKTRLNDQGGDYYGILRNSAGVPTVLAEFAFISNPSEEALLRDQAVIEAEGHAVFDAIVEYLTTDNAGSGYVDAYPRTTPAGSGGGSDNCVDPLFD